MSQTPLSLVAFIYIYTFIMLTVSVNQGTVGCFFSLLPDISGEMPTGWEGITFKISFFILIFLNLGRDGWEARLTWGC